MHIRRRIDGLAVAITTCETFYPLPKLKFSLQAVLHFPLFLLVSIPPCKQTLGLCGTQGRTCMPCPI